MTESAWDRAAFRASVQEALEEFLDEQATRLAPLGADAARLLAEARTSVSGGKRFRAAFCYWGFRAVAASAYDETDEAALVRACAALELLHASALVHDDYMDASDTRRGRPATHRGFATEHRSDGWRGDPEQYGASAAILLGDLLLSWSDELLRRCGLPGDQVMAALDVFDRLPLRGDHRPVPRRVGPGSRGGGRRCSDDGAALQVREVLHRASPAHRRDAGRRRRAGAPRPQLVRASARRGVPASRRPARRLR